MANTAGSDVRAWSSTTTPFSQCRPASRASSSLGGAPTPIRAASQAMVRPSPSLHPGDVTVFPREALDHRRNLERHAPGLMIAGEEVRQHLAGDAGENAWLALDHHGVRAQARAEAAASRPI